jgi:predicted secreted protein
MATKAKKAHGTQLQMGDGNEAAGTAITIESNTVDPYCTKIVTATAHGLHVGNKVTVAGMSGGTPDLDGDYLVTRIIASDAFEIADPTTYAAIVATVAGSGGTATPKAEAFTKVCEVGDIKGPGLSRDTLDVTTHDSPNDWEEFIVGIKKGGDVTFPINWVPDDPTHDNVTGLWAAWDDGVLRNWRIVPPITGVYLAFAALVTEIGPEFPVNDKLAADLTLKVSVDSAGNGPTLTLP